MRVDLEGRLGLEIAHLMPGYLTHWVNLKRERLGGKKMALVAGARKVAEAIWRLFHLGECFSFRRPFGPIPAEMLANGKA